VNIIISGKPEFVTQILLEEKSTSIEDLFQKTLKNLFI